MNQSGSKKSVYTYTRREVKQKAPWNSALKQQNKQHCSRSSIQILGIYPFKLIIYMPQKKNILLTNLFRFNETYTTLRKFDPLEKVGFLTKKNLTLNSNLTLYLPQTMKKNFFFIKQSKGATYFWFFMLKLLIPQSSYHLPKLQRRRLF